MNLVPTNLKLPGRSGSVIHHFLRGAVLVVVVASTGVGFRPYVNAVDGEWTSDPRQQIEPVEPKLKELTPEEKGTLAEGQALFRGLCSGCHGGMGRGGKGPDLTDNRWL